MRSFAIGGHSLAACPHWNAGADSPRNAHAGLLSPLPHSFRDCTGGRGGVRVLQFVRRKRDYDSFLAVPIQIGKRTPLDVCGESLAGLINRPCPEIGNIRARNHERITAICVEYNEPLWVRAPAVRFGTVLTRFDC